MAGFKHLLGSQLAEVGRLLGNSGLNPGEFQWHDAAYRRYEQIPELRHVTSNFRFQFTYSHGADITGYGGPRPRGRHNVKFSPGTADEWETHSSLQWPQVLQYVERWLQNLVRELNAESFWDAVAGARSGILGEGEGPADEPFNEAELGQIKPALDEALRRITELEDLQEQEREFVRAEFEELKSTLHVLKRRSWAKLALGTLMNIAAREVVPQGTMKEVLLQLFEYVKSIPGMLPSS